MKKRIFFVSDLRWYADPREWHGVFGSIKPEDNQRIMSLLAREQDKITKEDFELVSKVKAR